MAMGTWATDGPDAGVGVGPREAVALLAEAAVLVDVREVHEWEAGHVSGAIHLPLDLVPTRLDELPRDRRIVVVCRSGRRSAGVTDLLTRSAFDAVNLDGGLLAWVEEGLPIETDRGGEGQVA
jgi:rhodanese-related sulfurtransferase